MQKNEKIREIMELSQKLSTLKEKRNIVNAKARKFAEKRDKNNEKIRTLRIEIQKLIKARRDIHSELRELKQEQILLKKDMAEKVLAIKKLRQENEALARMKPSKSSKMIQSEIEKLEWKIQTTSLDLKDEKELVERVKELEKQLKVHKNIDRLTQKRIGLKAELKALEAKAKVCSDCVKEKADKSLEIREGMLRKIEEAQKLKAEASELHKQFLQARKESIVLQKEITQILGEISRLRSEIQSEEEFERKKIEESLMEDFEKKAREKLKRGEKLTWEEFKVLAEKGIA